MLMDHFRNRDRASLVGCMGVHRASLVKSLGLCKWMWESQTEVCDAFGLHLQARTLALISTPKNLSSDLCVTLTCLVLMSEGTFQEKISQSCHSLDGVGLLL